MSEWPYARNFTDLIVYRKASERNETPHGLDTAVDGGYRAQDQAVERKSQIHLTPDT